MGSDSKVFLFWGKKKHSTGSGSSLKTLSSLKLLSTVVFSQNTTKLEKRNIKRNDLNVKFQIKLINTYQYSRDHLVWDHSECLVRATRRVSWLLLYCGWRARLEVTEGQLASSLQEPRFYQREFGTISRALKIIWEFEKASSSVKLCLSSDVSLCVWTHKTGSTCPQHSVVWRPSR